MKAMDNAKALKAIEQHSLQTYLEKLADAKMHKVTLFSTFAQTGAPNLSAPAFFMLVDDLTQLVDLNSGRYHN